MKRASIDLGTNTIRLLIAEVTGATLKPIECHRAITRLGGGYSQEDGITEEAKSRTLKALRGFREVIDAFGIEPSEIKTAATSVVRRAVNAEAFTAEVLKETGITLTVISGEEEARLSLLGLLSAVDKSVVKKRLLSVDIGGGSTEFMVSEAGEFKAAWSLEMGVVHLSEGHIERGKDRLPSKEELSSMEAEISGQINNLTSNMKDNTIPVDYFKENGELLGTAGTITSLAAIDLGLKEYDREAVNNHIITKAKVEALYLRLLNMTPKERSEVTELEGGREDLIIPGIAILLETMTRFGFDRIRAIDAGLLEGLLLR